MNNFYEGGRRLCCVLLVLLSFITVCAQKSSGSPPTDAMDIKPLQIGDTIPEELWQMYFPVVSAESDVVQYLSLGDFKDKLIILDFWATWCGSCYKGLTNLDQWQKDFENDLLVVPVCYQESEEIKKVLIDKEWEFSSIYNDDLLKEYFPHKFLPHQIIISNDKIIAISSGAQLDKDKVLAMIDGIDGNFRVKNDIIDFDRDAILLQNSDSRFRKKLVYGSSFFNHIDGLGSTIGFSSTDEFSRLFFNNKRIIDLYFAVINPLMRNRIFFEVNDSARINYDKHDVNLDIEEWRSNNTYSYELIVPSNTSKNDMNSLALDDFDRHFDLDTEMVEREMDCYVIVNQEGKQFVDPYQKAMPKDNEMVLSFETLIQYLNTQVVGYPQRPIFINESSIDVGSKILINKENYEDTLVLQEALASYNLTLKRVKRNLEVFVIKDKS